jgi:DNA-directed RNA polymerase subunit K/omega
MALEAVSGPGAVPAADEHPHSGGSLENRFLLTAIAFQRSKQLKQGAKARIDGADHKATYLAVLEVLANTVSWSRD